MLAAMQKPDETKLTCCKSCSKPSVEKNNGYCEDHRIPPSSPGNNDALLAAMQKAGLIPSSLPPGVPGSLPLTLTARIVAGGLPSEHLAKRRALTIMAPSTVPSGQTTAMELALHTLTIPDLARSMLISKSLFCVGQDAPQWQEALKQLGRINGMPDKEELDDENGTSPFLGADPRLSESFGTQSIRAQFVQVLGITQQCVGNLHSLLAPYFDAAVPQLEISSSLRAMYPVDPACGANILGWSYCGERHSSTRLNRILYNLEASSPARFNLIVHCSLLVIAQRELASKHCSYASLADVFAGEDQLESFANTSGREELTAWLRDVFNDAGVGFSRYHYTNPAWPTPAEQLVRFSPFLSEQELSTAVPGSDAHVKYLTYYNVALPRDDMPNSEISEYREGSRDSIVDVSLFGTKLAASVDCMSIITAPSGAGAGSSGSANSMQHVLSAFPNTFHEDGDEEAAIADAIANETPEERRAREYIQLMASFG
jgi:hypothetical protein